MKKLSCLFFFLSLLFLNSHVFAESIDNPKKQRINLVKPFHTLNKSGSFDPSSAAWDGLSQFALQAESIGVKLETPRRWHWRKAKIQTPILIIGAENNELKQKALMDFLFAGGRVVLAGDFGGGSRLMDLFGVRRYRLGIEPSVWRSQKYIDIHQTAPILGQESDFILRQASSLFLNMPQWLARESKTPKPLLRSEVYRSNLPDKDLGGHVVLRIPFGSGMLILVSDPSLFINQMFGYGDNRRFSKNLLRYLTLPIGAKRVVLLWGDFDWQGKFEQQVSFGLQVSISFWEGVLELNKSLVSLPAYYESFPPYSPTGELRSRAWIREHWRKQLRKQPSEVFYPYLANIGLLILLMMLWLGWLKGQVSGMSSSYGRYNRQEEREKRLHAVRFQEQLDSYGEGYLSYLWPLILLREELVAFLSEKYHFAPDLEGKDPRNVPLNVLRLLEREGKSEHGDSCILEAIPLLYEIVKEIPSRQQWGDLKEKKLQAKDLDKYYQMALRSLRILGLEDEFRKPTLRKGRKD